MERGIQVSSVFFHFVIDLLPLITYLQTEHFEKKKVELSEA